MQDRTDLLVKNDAAAKVYLKDGLFAREIGSTLKQPNLAETYRQIAGHGEEAFYSTQYDFTLEKGAVNYPQADKIPRSSISPIIVLKEDRPIASAIIQILR